MKIIITGASGFIGRHLVHYFDQTGHRVVALSRNPEKAQSQFHSGVTCLPFKMHDPSTWLDELTDADALINLIGENIMSRRWTNSYKKKLRQSRIDSVRTIFKALQATRPQKITLIQASAVGYYGNTSMPVDEQAAAGSDFLARLTYDWERATEAIAELGVRRIITRFGVILGKDGGALARLIPIYKGFLGGTIGSGEQGFSWMHIEDLQRAMNFILQKETSEEVFNFVSPKPVSQKELNRTLAEVLKRPAFWRIPELPVKLLIGEMGKALILGGQYVQPAALLNAGFEFRFENMKDALIDLLRGGSD